MLELSSDISDKEVSIETKDVSLVFDARVARGLVVTVRALSSSRAVAADEHRVSVAISTENTKGLIDFAIREAAQAEIKNLIKKRQRFAHSDVLANQITSLQALAGQHEEAIALLRDEIQVAGTDLLRNRLARVLIEVERYVEADALIRESSEEWAISNLLTRAYICIRQGNIADAKQLISSAIERDYSDYSARLFAGAMFIWDGQYPEAIRSFKVASEERPRSSVPLVHMAAAYFALGQKQKAIGVLRKATSLNPLDDKAISFYCDLLFSVGRPDLAVGPLKRIYELWGSEARQGIIDRLSKAYLDSSHPDRALPILQRQLQVTPTNKVLLNNAGVAQWRRGALESAKIFLRRAADVVLSQSRIDSDDLIPINNYLILQLQSEDYKQVVDFGRRIVPRLQRVEVDLRIDVVLRYMEGLGNIGNPDEAARLAEHELAQKGLSMASKVKLATFLLHYHSIVSPSRDRVEALADIAFDAFKEEGLDDKVRAFGVNNAVFALLQFNELDKAGEKLSLIANILHRHAFVTATFGLFYLKKGDVERGKELYKEAVTLTDIPLMKGRIRQRMALELAKHYVRSGFRSETLYWLDRALSEKLGSRATLEQARQLKAQVLGGESS